MSNPFAQLGDYKSNTVDDSLVTPNYLTGIPDPNSFADQQFALVFRTLLKRDTRTKHRALNELNQLFLNLKKQEDFKLDDQVHLAYVQMYAKLSIDVSPAVRLLSNSVLLSMYQLLGRKTSKYLEYSVGPWLASTFDNDPQVSETASTALKTIFPNDKLQLLIEKMSTSIQTFICDCLTNASAQSLSDDRYVNKQESSQKYTGLMRSCIEILSNYPTLFDQSSADINELVESGRLWKFFSSSDRYLANSALKLAKSHLDNLESSVPVLWKELMRSGRKNAGGADVAFGIIQMMNVLTKKFPQQTWTDDLEVRREYMLSLGQFANSQIPHSSKFWPFFYNLVMLIPKPPQTDLSPLYKFLEKACLGIKHNIELENSIWGCFVSIVKQLDDDYAKRLFRAAEQSFKQVNGPHEALVKYLPALFPKNGVTELVQQQLSSKDTPFGYILVIAATKKFRDEIQSLITPEATVQQIKALVGADPDLKVPESIPVTEDVEWLDIAANSNKINAQAVVETLLSMGMEVQIMEYSEKLRSRVHVDLDSFALDHLNEMQILPSLVSAHGVFVSEAVAKTAVGNLIDQVLKDSDCLPVFMRVVKSNNKFITETIKENPEMQTKLDTLNSTVSNTLLQKLASVSLGHNQTSTKKNGPSMGGILAPADNLVVSEFDWTVPLECYVGKLRIDYPIAKKPIDEGVEFCLKLAREWHPLFRCRVAFSTEQIVKVCLVHGYLKCWELVAPNTSEFDDLHSAIKISAFMVSSASNEVRLELWKLLDDPKVAHIAATVLVKHCPDTVDFEPALLRKPTLQGAILVSNSARFKHLKEYLHCQNLIVREAMANRIADNEWMLIDQTLLSPDLQYKIKTDDPKTICKIINTFGNQTRDLETYVFESEDRIVEYTSLMKLDEVEDYEFEILEYAFNLPCETFMDLKCARRCLDLVNTGLSMNSTFGSDSEIVQELVDNEGSLDLAWIAVSICKSNTELQLVLLIGDEEISSSNIVPWLLFLNFFPDNSPQPTPTAFSKLFKFIIENTNEYEPSQTDSKTLPPTPPDFLGDLIPNLLYNMSIHFQPEVRDWYKELKDRNLIKKVDELFSNCVVAQILADISMEVKQLETDEIQIGVNLKQKEIKAVRELEDEFGVEIILAVPDQFPAKPVNVEIKNLAGVSEAKKRSWILEARQKCQSSGLFAALKGLLSHLDNFLNGVEPCAICYMLVDEKNKLPNKQCHQCHNIYHADCVFKWFETNRDKLCPMCRGPM